MKRKGFARDLGTLKKKMKRVEKDASTALMRKRNYPNGVGRRICNQKEISDQQGCKKWRGLKEKGYKETCVKGTRDLNGGLRDFQVGRDLVLGSKNEGRTSS